MKITVNAEELDNALIDQEAKRLKPEYDHYIAENEADSPEGQLEEWAAENIIERALIMQEARNTDMDIPAEDVDASFEEIKENLDEDAPVDEVRAEIELQMKVDRLLKDAGERAANPSDAELREFYDANREMFVRTEQVRAAHIIKHVNPAVDRETAFAEIVKVQEQLNAGATFEQLASEHSDCPDQAGDLGYFERGQMVEEFETVAFGMEVGQVSDIFLTDCGYHIVKVHDKIPGGAVPFEEVKEPIAEQLIEQRRTKAVEDFVDSLKEKAVIEKSDD